MVNPILCVVGTRPEVITMAPVIHRLREGKEGFDFQILATGQHRSLLDQALADFELIADQDLALMVPDQDLANFTARALTGLSGVVADVRPSLVLAQGDTTTVLCTALACCYNRIPFGHVEAGLPHSAYRFWFCETRRSVRKRWKPARCDWSASIGTQISQPSRNSGRIRDPHRTCDANQDKFVSQPEWDAQKQGWEWLFAIIDKNQDGRVDAAEYGAFQELKKQNPKWQELRSKQ